jgi:uncharacterized membrane protein
MQSRAKAFGHAIHPILIVYPLGLLTTAVIFDILYLVTDRSGFSIAAAYTIAAGVIGGLVAAVFGLVDWLAIPAGTRAKRIGSLHGLATSLSWCCSRSAGCYGSTPATGTPARWRWSVVSPVWS